MSVSTSVIMTVYNEEPPYLREAIESILNQSYTDFEFLIVDDGSSSPQVKEILTRYKNQDARIILCPNQTNLGLTASLNKALYIAQGTYVARIDSDDLSHRERLEKQLRFMEAHPDYALCGSWSTLIDENGQPTGEKRFSTQYREIKKRLILFNFFTHSSLFFRKATLLSLGGYNPAFKKAQDYDLLLKVSAHHPVAILPEFLCSLRLHPKSISAHAKKKQEWYALRARCNAVTQYGYPISDFFKILPALCYFLFVPYFLEKRIFQFLHKQK